MLACLIGSIAGLLIGMNYSLLAVLEGTMTGIMSGMMGAMLGEMINENQSLYLVRIFLFYQFQQSFYLLFCLEKMVRNIYKAK